MDFDAAIVAHVRWKYRLQDYIEGKGQEALDAEIVACDDRCDLGKWLKVADKAHSSTTLEDLRKEHAAFHKCAADVVRTSQAGRANDARALLGTASAYTTHSTAVVHLIKKCAGECG